MELRVVVVGVVVEFELVGVVPAGPVMILVPTAVDEGLVREVILVAMIESGSAPR